MQEAQHWEQEALRDTGQSLVAFWGWWAQYSDTCVLVLRPLGTDTALWQPPSLRVQTPRDERGLAGVGRTRGPLSDLRFICEYLRMAYFCLHLCFSPKMPLLCFIQRVAPSLVLTYL